MKALRFDLLGRYAFFKNPESNTGTEFSFEHIHKPALLGILGAIIGLNGKSKTDKSNPLPEYYNILKDIKLSIVPHKPIFENYYETITNTTGFANGEFTQVLKRNVLQNVGWTIFIDVDSINENYKEDMIDLIQKHESKYPIFLGNNAFSARIKNVDIINLESYKETEEIVINSIFKTKIIQEKYDYTQTDLEIPYDLKTYNPIDLNELQLYKYDWFDYTNLMIDAKEDVKLYQYKDMILSFI